MIMEPARVVITGIGPITAVGIGAEAFYSGLRRQRSPVRRITRFDSSPWRSRIGAEIDDFEPSDFMESKMAKRLDRFGQFALASARLALRDAELEESSLDGDRVAVQMGSALGGVAYAEQQVINLLRDGIRGVDPRVAQGQSRRGERELAEAIEPLRGLRLHEIGRLEVVDLSADPGAPGGAVEARDPSHR